MSSDSACARECNNSGCASLTKVLRRGLSHDLQTHNPLINTPVLSAGDVDGDPVLSLLVCNNNELFTMVDSAALSEIVDKPR